MAITVSPTTIALVPNSAPVVVTVTGGTPGATLSLTDSAGNPVGRLNLQAIGTDVVPTPTAPIYFSVQVSNPGQGGPSLYSSTIYIAVGSDTATLPVTISQDVSNEYSTTTPWTASSIISQVYSRTNENANSVSNMVVQGFLNAGITEISQGLTPVKQTRSIWVPQGVNIVTLPNDIQELLSVSYSTVVPSGAGTLVYRLTQMDPGTFFDFSGGQPGTGFGNPIAFTVIADAADATGGNISIQLYPMANGGFLNLYYIARPIPFADTLTSVTNMDPQAMEPLILWTCARVCEARERTSDADRFIDQYDKKMIQYNDWVARRNRPKTGIVRDVTNQGATGAPPWLPS